MVFKEMYVLNAWKCKWTGMSFAWRPGENTVRPGHQYQLAERKGKDCDRQPNQYATVRHMNEGRYEGMAKVLTLMSFIMAELP